MKRSTLVALAVSFLFLAGVDSVAHAEKRIGRYVSPNCTYYAALRRPDLLVFTVDAWHWDNEARKHNFPVVNRPAVGAIVVFEPGVYGASSVGHVAYVERVNKDGTFAISEMNFGLTPAQQKSVNYSRTHLSPGRGISFILRKPAVKPPTPKPPTPVPPKPPTPVTPTVVPPTVVPVSDDIQLLQACLNEGYVCMPVPFEVTGPVSWYNGYEIEGYRSEYLGFDLEPGTVITAPFDGLVRKADGSGLVLKVKLPSGEEVGIKFYFQGYQDFEVLVDDRTSVSAGDPLARFVRTIQWDQSSGVGPDFEYPGMLQIHLGDYNTPITPLVTWGTDGLRYLAADCRDTRSLVLFSPQHFQYLEELAKKGGFNLRVDPLLFPSGPVGEWISISDRCHGPVIANGKGVPEGYPAAMLIYETQDGEIRKILIDVSTMNYW